MSEKLLQDLVRIKVASRHFDLSESFFRHAIGARTIPAYRLGRSVFVKISEIEKMIEGNKIAEVK
jgi:hypothetical protein